MLTTKEILIHAKKVAPEVSSLSGEKRNEALFRMAEALVNNTDKILQENEKDVNDAREKINDVMIDRLTLTKDRISAMAKGLLEVADLPDPLGKILRKTKRPNGIIIIKKSVSIGVVAIIYESRPNVTSDAASLAIKSGNVCVLRSGKEAYRSAKAIVDALKIGLKNADCPVDAIQLIEDRSHESARELMRSNKYVDLLIPRGSERLINTCVENATVPCIHTGTGICHIYVDKTSDIDMALKIVNNAKTSRPSVCNAAEVCLVNRDIANLFLPRLKSLLIDQRIKENKIPVELKGDEEVSKFVDCSPASLSDYDTEFLDYILALKIVSDVKEAVNHILEHSTGHSEAIVSSNPESIDYFTTYVDSAALYVNASTRFTDGGEFGLGCEMGISTQKLHARGPMGLEELTTYKYIIQGNGQVR
ncbi:MAG: glutamate-5-semialdehyde dehydrogenase [Ruminococcaceae bacterium]|nr:glutamate-5-semialdehyde dehydrogenase [Oscillospiraceae bacterium]